MKKKRKTRISISAESVNQTMPPVYKFREALF